MKKMSYSGIRVQQTWRGWSAAPALGRSSRTVAGAALPNGRVAREFSFPRWCTRRFGRRTASTDSLGPVSLFCVTLRVCVLTATVLGTGLVAADPEAPTTRANTFLDMLSGAQRSEATWRFDDPERGEIRYAPFRLDGLATGDLDESARVAGDALLAVTLSSRGFQKLRSIRLLERDVKAQESGLMRLFGLRDPGRYLWAVFGAPSADSAWSFRYEGHHLSMHVTFVPGAPPASTPLFLGAQPRVVPDGMPSAGVAALGEEERLARALYASLTADQRAEATPAYEADRGLMLGQVPTLEPPAPLGIARAELDAAQQAMLDHMLDQFVGFWAEPIASARRAEIAAARDGLHFAHVEAVDPPHSFYTRVSGHRVLLEIDNTEGGDHVHAVWHEHGADFGADLLARHLERAHGRTVARLQ